MFVKKRGVKTDSVSEGEEVDSDGEIPERTGAWRQKGSKAPLKGRGKQLLNCEVNPPDAKIS